MGRFWHQWEARWSLLWRGAVASRHKLLRLVTPELPENFSFFRSVFVASQLSGYLRLNEATTYPIDAPLIMNHTNVGSPKA
jgi:hypothetical protein